MKQFCSDTAVTSLFFWLRLQAPCVSHWISYLWACMICVLNSVTLTLNISGGATDLCCNYINCSIELLFLWGDLKLSLSRLVLPLSGLEEKPRKWRLMNWIVCQLQKLAQECNFLHPEIYGYWSWGDQPVCLNFLTMVDVGLKTASSTPSDSSLVILFSAHFFCCRLTGCLSRALLDVSRNPAW